MTKRLIIQCDVCGRSNENEKKPQPWFFANIVDAARKNYKKIGDVCPECAKGGPALLAKRETADA